MTSSNTLKVVALMAALTALLGLIGYWVGGTGGVIFALGFSIFMNFGAYWFSDSIAIRMTGAQPVDPTQAPGLYDLVARLAMQAGIPTPRVYVIDSPLPNAFATGRDPAHGAVAVTTGILQTLSQEELAGVLAHELAHIRRRDTLIATVVATIAGAITTLANLLQWTLLFGGLGGGDDDGGGLVGGLLLIFVAPILAVLIQLGISRAREFDADAEGAHISGNPLALASALAKIDTMARRSRRPLAANPAMASLFIVNPLSGVSGGLAGLFSTHPPVEARIERLQAMAAGV
ncbi:MAG: zinc metalloprotease HtpX [Anaerolineae bacterium]